MASQMKAFPSTKVTKASSSLLIKMFLFERACRQCSLPDAAGRSERQYTLSGQRITCARQSRAGGDLEALKLLWI
jgi:hypothetical protein